MVLSKTAAESDVEDGGRDVEVSGGVVHVLDAVREGEVRRRLII